MLRLIIHCVALFFGFFLAFSALVSDDVSITQKNPSVHKWLNSSPMEPVDCKCLKFHLLGHLMSSSNRFACLINCLAGSHNINLSSFHSVAC